MVRSRPLRVVVLYCHPLLGEGVGKILMAQRGLAVTAVASDDRAATADALAASPDVVVLERGAGMESAEIVGLAPGALVIDIALDRGPTWTYHREAIEACPETILRAIRQRRRGARVGLIGPLASLLGAGL